VFFRLKLKYIHVFRRGVYFALFEALLRKLAAAVDGFEHDTSFCDEIFFPFEWG